MESGLRLYDMEDIIAMKLAAISDDGSRLKDFIDMAFLSTRFRWTPCSVVSNANSPFRMYWAR